MLLSAVSVLVVAQSSSEILEGLMNNPVFVLWTAFAANGHLTYYTLLFVSFLFLLLTGPNPLSAATLLLRILTAHAGIFFLMMDSAFVHEDGTL